MCSCSKGTAGRNRQHHNRRMEKREKMLNIVAASRVSLTVSGTLVLVSILAIGLLGFRLGIDFQGGTLWQFRLGAAAPSQQEVSEAIQNVLQQRNVYLNYSVTNHTFLVRLPVIGEEEHGKLVQALQQRFPSFTELSFQSIGPSVGAELRKKAILALVLVLVGISAYIAFAFRKASWPIQSWKYGIVTLVTLFHDVVVPAGFLAVGGRYFNLDLDSSFAVALLVIMGFSVHDTIVVFDRIRENLLLRKKNTSFREVINESVNQTLARSLNTSLTLLFVLVALYFWGPATLQLFILTLLIGTILGTYSSIFVASPLLLLISPRRVK
ncbi:protein translocase subunit SecF [Candidatus Parcubacteria bacterium]|nr:MAG: protein translocase subunit SecF [Candidatus Parcubacteria bacterium]